MSNVYTVYGVAIGPKMPMFILFYFILFMSITSNFFLGEHSREFNIVYRASQPAEGGQQRRQHSRALAAAALSALRLALR